MTPVKEPAAIGLPALLDERDRIGKPVVGDRARVAQMVEPAQDVRELLPYLEHIARFDIVFPGYRDGRGYSSARILRDAGYTGVLRAVGDVLRDQVFIMLRCGFDEFLLKDRTPSEAVVAAAKRYSVTYQSAADAATPVWALRRAGAA